MRMRTRCQFFARELQRRDGRLPRHTRKRVEKRLQRIAGCELVDQILQRHTSTDEYRFAAENFRVAVNDVRNGGHDFLQYSPPEST